MLEARRGPIGEPLRCVSRIVGEKLGAYAARDIETSEAADELTAPVRAGYVVDKATERGRSVFHAAVACGLSDVYDLLLELPPAFGKVVAFERRADPSLRTSRGRQELRLNDLTPIQLATRLGDRRMFMHILHRRMVIQWKWGPVTQYQCDLDEIDSASNTGGNDVMELVAHLESLPQCQEMILDDL